MESEEQINFLEILFHGLAEVFASPGTRELPAWMAAPGVEWPFYEEASRLALSGAFGGWLQAANALKEVQAATLAIRSQEYERLFVGLAQPPIWLYEACYIDGRILGASSFAVSAIYEHYGLEVEGSELPDHAAVELAFLAHLLHQQNRSTETPDSKIFRSARTAFIKEHAGLWLPGVAKKLVKSGYPAWAAIGLLTLAGLSEGDLSGKAKRNTAVPSNNLLPFADLVDQCIFCGFCVQVCPTRALTVQEDATLTSIVLSIPACIHCKKCVKVCPAHVIEMVPAQLETENTSETTQLKAAQQTRLLIESPRAACPNCGEPTISQAELDYVIQCIGHPNWLDYCNHCRSSLQKTTPNSAQAIRREKE
jgi:ferredoxin